MTSLIAWVAADQRGPSSLNLATDSRITWASDSSGRTMRWDQTQKVFASVLAPVVVGYVGDVEFPALALPHLLTRLDRCVSPAHGAPATYVVDGVRRLARDYPNLGSFTIYIGYREGGFMKSTFGLTRLSHRPRAASRGPRWTHDAFEIPQTSRAIVIDGSGRAAVKEAVDSWCLESEASVSRAISSGFIDALLEGKDPKSGGAPQWGALYRKGNGRLLGVVHKGRRYFAGGELVGGEELGDVEWRNALSERTDGATKRRLPGAQPQPRPQTPGE